MTTQKQERVVGMFCGLQHYDAGFGTCLRPERCKREIECLSRILSAVELALQFGCYLIIAGDRLGGLVVQRFEEIAKEAGVCKVFPFVFRDGVHLSGSTLTDARGVAELLVTKPELAEVRKLMLVTDAFHMRRARIILKWELKELVPVRSFEIEEHSVLDGIQPDNPERTRKEENHGVRDYLAGKYREGGRRPYALSTATVSAPLPLIVPAFGGQIQLQE